MSDNLVLEHLRALRGDMAEIKLDIRDMKHRTTLLEIAVANLAASEASHYASLSMRVDRVEERLERRVEIA